MAKRTKNLTLPDGWIPARYADPKELARALQERKDKMQRAKIRKSMRRKRVAKILDEVEFKEQMGVSEDDMTMLNAIASGFAPRNAQSILKAIQMKADYRYEKPAQKVDPNSIQSFAALVAAAGRPVDPSAPVQPPPSPDGAQEQPLDALTLARGKGQVN